MAPRSLGAVSVLEVDPDLTQHLDPRQADLARSRATARVAILHPSQGDPWDWLDSPDGHLGLLVIDGVLSRNVTLLGRTTMELPKAIGFRLAAYLVPGFVAAGAMATIALAVARCRRREANRHSQAAIAAPEPPDPLETARLDVELERYNS